MNDKQNSPYDDEGFASGVRRDAFSDAFIKAERAMFGDRTVAIDEDYTEEMLTAIPHLRLLHARAGAVRTPDHSVVIIVVTMSSGGYGATVVPGMEQIDPYYLPRTYRFQASFESLQINLNGKDWFFMQRQWLYRQLLQWLDAEVQKEINQLRDKTS